MIPQASKPADGERKPGKLLASYWRETARYKKATQEWHEDARTIEDIYLEAGRNIRDRRSKAQFALLWANVEVLKPSVYARLPVVECTRRYRDRDPLARTGAEMIERATNTIFETQGFNDVFEMVRDDRLLGGRGQVWVRYEADVAGAMRGEDDPEEPGDPVELVEDERVCLDYVAIRDFGHNVAETWPRVWLVWRCVYMDRGEMVSRFGEGVANRVSYDASAPASVADRSISGSDGEGGGSDTYCKVWEFWDKRRKLVTWATEGEPEPIDQGPPPLKLQEYFPCPMPCYATKTSRSLIPKPDYAYYADQAAEINDLTAKIKSMMKWLVVKGFMPGAPSRVSDPLEEVLSDRGNDTLMVKVDDFTEFTERGGAARLVEWLPLDMIIQALQAAIQARAQLIQDVFQITGLSDILRGQTDPNETLGAQELKAQTGSQRVRNTRGEISRFCRDVAHITAEVVAEKFGPETLAKITGFKYQPAPIVPGMPDMITGMSRVEAPEPYEAPWADSGQATFDDAVVKLLRDDQMRSYRIDIETDSTSQPNEAQEQQRRTEFLTATTAFMDRAVQAVQAMPEMAPLAGEMLTFAIRGFRAGRPLEEVTEKTFASLGQKAGANKPPSPEEVKAQMEQQKAQMDAQARQQQTAMDRQRFELEVEVEREKARIAIGLAQAQLQQAQQELAFKAEEHRMRLQEMQARAALAAQAPQQENRQV
jgi:hypothetical protein